MNITDFKNAIWEYTRKINENTNKSFNPILEKYGLTMLQGRVLMELYHYGSSSIGNLAERIYTAGANISAICKRLEKEGFVERIRSQEDERVVMVVLTIKGNKISIDIDEKLNRVISKELSNETEESYNEIITGIKKLDGLLQKMAIEDER